MRKAVFFDRDGVLNVDKSYLGFIKDFEWMDGIITAVYYCPYLEGASVKAYDKKSDWRKPAPGMVLQAAKDYDIDLKHSFMIGDMPRDVECGQRAGMDGYLFTGGRLDDFVRAIVAERKGRESI